MFKNFSILVIGLVLVVFFFAIGPLALIWAGNELGQYLWPDRVVPYTVWTWMATAIVMIVFGPNIKLSKKE
jgi:hypothetical protein